MDLNELRGEINAIDEEILNLFLRRMDITSQVADYKKAHDLPIYQPQREREILETIEQKAGPVLGRYARDLFAKLMELSKDYQREVLK
jgi:chorismate mutase/prephenate dehydratase